jgi:hypothetical protein
MLGKTLRSGVLNLIGVKSLSGGRGFSPNVEVYMNRGFNPLYLVFRVGRFRALALFRRRVCERAGKFNLEMDPRRDRICFPKTYISGYVKVDVTPRTGVTCPQT